MQRNILSLKGENTMGVTCREQGKMRSIMKKLDNELLRKVQEEKEKKEKKEGKGGKASR